MLVLTRAIQERIVITPPGQSPITVAVVGVEGGQFRLGIEADQSVAIHRQEVQDRIDRERGGAA